MSSKHQSTLIVDPDAASRSALEELVRSAGYDVAVSSSQAEGFKFVQDAAIDLLLLSADLADIQCCDALAEIKGNAATSGTRVILLTRGGAPERARGLDLGADEVLTSPWEPAELLARIRVQLREKHALDELLEKTRIADEGREVAQTAFQALAVTEKMTRDAFSLERALKIGVSALFAVALLIAGIFVLFSRRANKEANRAYSVIAQLERGAHRQEQLMADARNARASLQQSDVLDQKQQLRQQSEELRQKISGAEPGDVSSLRQQLAETTARLKRVENESQSAEEVIRAYAPSVCLLHVVVEFRDKDSGQVIRIAADATGKPRVDNKGMVSLDTDGTGPALQLDFFGTGFLVASDGRLLTNHHVAEPWWGDKELKQILDLGAAAFVVSYTAYFPGTSQGIAAKIDGISPHADLATLKLQTPAPPHTTLLELDDRSEASVTGDAVVLIGYPTGIEGILARAGSDVTRKLAENAHDVTQILSQLAAQHLIRPTTTQGHIGDVLMDKIVYDAATTSGGSGGPLFNRDGKVIGVNSAILKDFGGSNLAVPVRYADKLVK